jgi:cytochrome c peroxidase
MVENPEISTRARALLLSVYLRKGLVTPRQLRDDALSRRQARGEEIFLSSKAECASCHVPESNYTNQQPFPLEPLPTRLGFDEEADQAFKTPSLRGLVGRAPYFHDGSAPSLFYLIETNHDRMGHTSHLGRADRDALIAFLETL